MSYYRLIFLILFVASSIEVFAEDGIEREGPAVGTDYGVRYSPSKYINCQLIILKKFVNQLIFIILIYLDFRIFTTTWKKMNSFPNYSILGPNFHKKIKGIVNNYY